MGNFWTGKQIKGGLQPSFYRVPLDLLPSAVYLYYSSIGSGQILRTDILTACAVLVYNQILQGGFCQNAKSGNRSCIRHYVERIGCRGTAGNRHKCWDCRRWYVSGICGAVAVCVWFHAFGSRRPCESCDTVTRPKRALQKCTDVPHLESVWKNLRKTSENGFFSLKSATPGGLKFFSTKIVEKFFFQKPLKTRFSDENVDPRGYQKKHIKIFYEKSLK